MEMVTCTQLDLRLGLVKLTDEQQQILNDAVVPVLARVVVREAQALAKRRAELGQTATAEHSSIPKIRKQRTRKKLG